jgi:hypothetical protein
VVSGSEAGSTEGHAAAAAAASMRLIHILFHPPCSRSPPGLPYLSSTSQHREVKLQRQRAASRQRSRATTHRQEERGEEERRRGKGRRKVNAKERR